MVRRAAVTAMPISTVDQTKPAPAPREGGFTLVELMVVIAIIGLAAAAVVLTLPAADGGAVTEATRFGARVAALRDRAIIDGRSYAVWVSASGFGFERRAMGQWQPLEEGRLAHGDWRSGTAVLVGGAARGKVSFNRIGLPSQPMQISMASAGTRATVDINSNGEVAVR